MISKKAFARRIAAAIVCIIACMALLTSCRSDNDGNVSGNAKDGVVSDRDNSGGALGSAVDEASRFVSEAISEIS